MQNKFFIILIIFYFVKINAQVDDVKLHEGLVDISLFIIENDFTELNDLQKIDSIYIFALKYFDYNYSETLLALTFAALPFQKMPLKIPVINLAVDLELPTIRNNLFKKKLEKLPSHFLIDSPKSKFGDKDKISHFFGNAFIQYNFSYFQFSSFLGAFVELFEGTFKISGAVDQRDLYINKFGELFGETLSENPKILPSSILSLDALNHIIISR